MCERWKAHKLNGDNNMASDDGKNVPFWDGT